MMLEYRSFAWWYWVATVFLLGLGLLGGRQEAFQAALLLSAIQILHFGLLERKFTAFSVQLRIAFMLILAAAYWPPLRFLYWVPFLGTSVMVFFGYCLLARALSLLPWNRQQPVSLELLRKTFLSPPVKGSILKREPS